MPACALGVWNRWGGGRDGPKIRPATWHGRLKPGSETQHVHFLLASHAPLAFSFVVRHGSLSISFEICLSRAIMQEASAQQVPSIQRLEFLRRCVQPIAFGCQVPSRPGGTKMANGAIGQNATSSGKGGCTV